MLFEQSELNALIGMIACIGSGLLLKYALMISKQKWVENFHSTITFLALPLITFIITKVISNNIALSLGMVGALSIVRFRNPVKNSLELVVYFALITIGIANSVHMKWGLTLTITIVILILISHFFRNTIYIIYWLIIPSRPDIRKVFIDIIKNSLIAICWALNNYPNII